MRSLPASSTSVPSRSTPTWYRGSTCSPASAVSTSPSRVQSSQSRGTPAAARSLMPTVYAPSALTYMRDTSASISRLRACGRDEALDEPPALRDPGRCEHRERCGALELVERQALGPQPPRGDDTRPGATAGTSVRGSARTRCPSPRPGGRPRRASRASARSSAPRSASTASSIASAPGPRLKTIGGRALHARAWNRAHDAVRGVPRSRPRPAASSR